MSEGITVFLMLIVIVMSIAWVLLPFLVMGVNKRLDKIINLLSDQPTELDSAGNISSQHESGDASRTIAGPEKKAASEMGKRDAKVLIPIIVVVILVALALSIML